MPILDLMRISVMIVPGIQEMDHRIPRLEIALLIGMKEFLKTNDIGLLLFQKVEDPVTGLFVRPPLIESEQPHIVAHYLKFLRVFFFGTIEKIDLEKGGKLEVSQNYCYKAEPEQFTLEENPIEYEKDIPDKKVGISQSGKGERPESFRTDQRCEV